MHVCRSQGFGWCLGVRMVVYSDSRWMARRAVAVLRPPAATEDANPPAIMDM
jgi:hypothetical protein